MSALSSLTNVEFVCEHAASQRLSGEEIAARLAWIREEFLCPWCQEEQFGVPEGMLVRLLNLPDLAGSPAQIEWARKIRLGFIRSSILDLGRCQRVTDGLDGFLDVLDRSDIGASLRTILDTAPARWWIDHRNDIAAAAPCPEASRA